MKASIVITALLAIGSDFADAAFAASSSVDGAGVVVPTSEGRAVAGAPPPALIPGEVDLLEAYASSTFPIRPDSLLIRAREVLSPEIEIGTKDGGACLSPDFEFVAAVVGPIPRDEYLEALATFKLGDSFDIEQNYFGFTVDPIQTNRVWFFTRQVARHVAPFMGASPANTNDGGVLTLPPQLMHMDFDPDGLVREFGFYTVDRRQGNTGGLGGAFGYFYGVGRPLPIPECRPYSPSFRFRMLGYIGKLGKMLSKKK
jgi:hypothetical protein